MISPESMTTFLQAMLLYKVFVTHKFAHTLTNSLTNLHIHSKNFQIHSQTFKFNYNYSQTHECTHKLTNSITNSQILSTTHKFSQQLTNSLTNPQIHSQTHSFLFVFLISFQIKVLELSLCNKKTYLF